MARSATGLSERRRSKASVTATVRPSETSRRGNIKKDIYIQLFFFRYPDRILPLPLSWQKWALNHFQELPNESNKPISTIYFHWELVDFHFQDPWVRDALKTPNIYIFLVIFGWFFFQHQPETVLTLGFSFWWCVWCFWSTKIWPWKFIALVENEERNQWAHDFLEDSQNSVQYLNFSRSVLKHLDVGKFTSPSTVAGDA